MIILPQFWSKGAKYSYSHLSMQTDDQDHPEYGTIHQYSLLALGQDDDRIEGTSLHQASFQEHCSTMQRMEPKETLLRRV